SFTWPDVPAGTPDNVVADGQRIALSGRGSTLGLLVSSGGQASAGNLTGAGTVTYTDGTTQAFTITFGNYFFPAMGGTVAAASEPTLNSPAGSQAPATFVFLAAVPLDPHRTAASVTLPTIAAEVANTGAGFGHVFAVTIA